MLNREKLDDIILKNGANDWWKPDLFVSNTLPLLPPELEVIANPPQEENNYNCFIYALGLSEKSDIVSETKGFIYDTFVKKLIEVGELIKVRQPQDGDYVVYQDVKDYSDNLTHIGVVHGDYIVSKWAWGPLIKHTLWDVPKSYGEDVFYLTAITSEKALDLYNEYKDFSVDPG